MRRATIALAGFGFLLLSPANAANLIHPSAATKSVQRGVTVWKGAPPVEAAPTLSAPREPRCRTIKIVAERIGYPPRRLKTHGFWSGQAAAPYSYGVATSGFYADRIAAGL
ncbi:MAG TPA: hypothetical protein PKM48_07835 [Parvularculaceae bacterium]|nr:hypothetical protein [Parvularculaceae bacterium]HNS87456.1 hypothetical protein [Parvularculaceae bacterium]